jgi:probable rRNA maturation factor
MIEINNTSSIYIDETRLEKYLTKMFDYLKIDRKNYLSITYMNQIEMQELHIKWMNEDGPTDVMSFPMDNQKNKNDNSILGDIVICPQVALQDAVKERKNPARHLVFLHAHGLLHLVGHDHMKLNERKIMRNREQGIMKFLESVK